MKFVYLLLVLLSGCTPDKILDVLVLESQSIINNNDSRMKYLLAYQMSNNSNGMVFQLSYNDNPCFEPTGEYPTKVIKYKDKFGIAYLENFFSKFLEKSFFIYIDQAFLLFHDVL